MRGFAIAGENFEGDFVAREFGAPHLAVMPAAHLLEKLVTVQGSADSNVLHDRLSALGLYHSFDARTTGSVAQYRYDPPTVSFPSPKNPPQPSFTPGASRAGGEYKIGSLRAARGVPAAGLRGVEESLPDPTGGGWPRISLAGKSYWRSVTVT